MSAALERVIEEQQKKIDRLNEYVQERIESDRQIFDDKTLFFNKLHIIVSFKLYNCFKHEKTETFEEYMSYIKDLALDMIDHGWCFPCKDWKNFCECNS